MGNTKRLAENANAAPIFKGWKVESEASKDIIRRWSEIGYCNSAMAHHDSPEQVTLICDLIDAIDGPIQNDWSGETMTKDEAKEYIREYRR